MKLTLDRIESPYVMQVTNQTGQTTNFDASPELGGKEKGMRPMEVLASSLAACASIDVINILQKQKQEIESYKVEIEAKRRDEVPAIFETIHLKFILKGKLTENKVKRAIELSMEKYCSVTKILEKTCQISAEFEIIK